jgi:hypothetical protein
MDSAVASDDQGRFQFFEVPAGVYLIIYDSGVGDFDSGLQEWGGQTLNLSSIEWLSDTYYADAGEECTLRLPAGMPLFGFNFAAYVMQALYFCDYPFILAHDFETTFSESEFEPIAVEVTEGKTSQIEFPVAHFVPDPAVSTPAPSTPLPTLAPSTPTTVEAPLNTIQGLLFDANTDEPLAGKFEVVVGWDFEQDPQGPGGVTGNLIFIGGKPQGDLIVAETGEFATQEVDYPLYMDPDFAMLLADEGQPLMMAIRGGPLKETAILNNEGGEPVIFQLEEGQGIDLGKVYVTP